MKCNIYLDIDGVLPVIDFTPANYEPAFLEYMLANFLDSFDLIVSETLASEVDKKTMGVPGATALLSYEFMVKEL